jgi:hypothetical protein
VTGATSNDADTASDAADAFRDIFTFRDVTGAKSDAAGVAFDAASIASDAKYEYRSRPRYSTISPLDRRSLKDFSVTTSTVETKGSSGQCHHCINLYSIGAKISLPP